jgi:chromosome segregation ATPase
VESGVADGDIIDLDRLRSAVTRQRDGVEQVLASRQRRRILERQVDELERSLRDEAVAQEELRQAQLQAQRELEAVRTEHAELRQSVERERSQARALLDEFEVLKQEILELHAAREAAAAELLRIETEVQRRVEEQRRLWRECRESAEALTQLRRSLGGVLAEVRYVLSDHDSGDE